MNKNLITLITDGIVESKGRKFTKLIGGFSENNPSMTTKQIAELLQYANGDKTVNLTINRNIEHFEEGIDIIDLKNSVSMGNPVYETLKTLGYSKQAISNSKNIYILSQSGFLLYLKFAEGEKSVELYKDFIEDYFKTKAENKNMKSSIASEIKELKNERFKLMGIATFCEDENIRIENNKKAEELNERIIKLTTSLETEKISESLEKQSHLTESKSDYQTLAECGDNFNCKVGSKTMGKIMVMSGIAKRNARGKTVPYMDRVPQYSTTDLETGTHLWKYNECIKVIDSWLKKIDEYNRFYGITDSELMEIFVGNLWKRFRDGEIEE